jgi:hypothetical protein
MARQIISKVALNLLWIAAAAFILAASAASAQTYPPDVQTVTADADDTTPEPGSTVDVTATVLDANGDPVEGAEVTFTVTSGEGTFANGQTTITVTTDANGVATAALTTGSTPGNIVVRVDANGVVSQVTLSTGSPQALPKTGGPSGSVGTGLPLAPALAAAMLVLFLAAGAVGVRKLGTTRS